MLLFDSNSRFFDVEPSHTALFAAGKEGQDGTTATTQQQQRQIGVVFNDETVTDPLPEKFKERYSDGRRNSSGGTKRCVGLLHENVWTKIGKHVCGRSRTGRIEFGSPFGNRHQRFSLRRR